MKLDDMIISLDDLRECERKIIVDNNEQALNATKLLLEKYNGAINHNLYQRKMVYLDTADNSLAMHNMIFRLTEEENVVKATIHMHNNLPGDQKEILKFFFNNTTLDEVINFFNNSLSMMPITGEVVSTRTEYICYYNDEKFEVSVDGVDDETRNYYSFEFECDNFPGGKEHDSIKVNHFMKNFALTIGLDTNPIVDKGTEDIYEFVTGKPFFETFKIQEKKQNF